jgi:hypothetical protein
MATTCVTQRAPVRVAGGLVALILSLTGCTQAPDERAAQPVPELAESARGDASASRTVEDEVIESDGGGGASWAQARAFAYVSESNSVVLFGGQGQQLDVPLRLKAPPTELAADAHLLVVGFPTGDLATIDLRTGRQIARASSAELRGAAVGGDLILDELLVVRPGVLLSAGRVADAATGTYRSFVEYRATSTLRSASRTVLAADLGVIQDIALPTLDQPVALLSDGRLYDLKVARATGNPGLGSDAQVLRYGPGGVPWIASGDSRPGVLTPSGAFVRTPGDRGRVTDIVPLPDGRAAALLSQPSQVWILTSSGEVTKRIPVDDYPYAGLLVGSEVWVGSVNNPDLQVIEPDQAIVVRRLKLGQGVVRLGTAG